MPGHAGIEDTERALSGLASKSEGPPLDHADIITYTRDLGKVDFVGEWISIYIEAAWNGTEKSGSPEISNIPGTQEVLLGNIFMLSYCTLIRLKINIT